MTADPERERTYEIAYNDRRARKGDYLLLHEDHKWYAANAGRNIMAGKPTSGVLIPAGTVVKVIWTGKSYDKGLAGTTKWRIGVVWPGRTKPLFLNQAFFGSMEFVTKSDYDAQQTA